MKSYSLLKGNFCVRGGRRATLAALALAIAVCGPGCEKSGDTAYMQKSKTGSGEASFFVPDEKDIITDKDTGLQIIRNVMSVTFSPEADMETINKVVESINGEIVGYDYAVNHFQIRVPGADIRKIDELRMKILGDFREVEMASRCPVSAHKNPYYVK